MSTILFAPHSASPLVVDHLRCHCGEDACNDKMKEITTTV